MEIKNKIKKIVALVLNCKANELTDTSGLLTQYNWDSLAHIEILTQIEDEFNMKIPDDIIANLDTIEKLTVFVMEAKQ